jgi:hypothetical protein
VVVELNTRRHNMATKTPNFNLIHIN